MRGYFGYVFYEINRLKAEGKLPKDFQIFPLSFLLVMLAITAVILGANWLLAFVLAT